MRRSPNRNNKAEALNKTRFSVSIVSRYGPDCQKLQQGA